MCLSTKNICNAKGPPIENTDPAKLWHFHQGSLLQRDLNLNFCRALPCRCPVGWSCHSHQVIRNPSGKKRAAQMGIASIARNPPPSRPPSPPHHLKCPLFPGGLPLYEEFGILPTMIHKWFLPSAQTTEHPNWNWNNKKPWMLRRNAKLFEEILSDCF